MGKIAALVLITGFGIYFLAIGKVENLNEDFKLTETRPAKWATAFYLALYSYDGWYSLNTVVEEIKLFLLSGAFELHRPLIKFVEKC